MLPQDQPYGSDVNVQPVPTHRSKLLIVLVVLFGLGTAGFGLLAFLGYGVGLQARSSLNSAKQSSYTKGQQDQQKSDDAKYLASNESPFRNYQAPDIYGSFLLKFPKNWNIYAVETKDSSTQLSLFLHPDLVRQVSGSDNAYATRLVLTRSTADDIQKQHAEDVKQGKLSLKNITVSGIQSFRYEGKFDGKHDGSTVLVPVRDKTIIISNDDKQFANEYNQILSQAQITP